ncbi:hypothetical protein N3K66_001202 [Trichothecium roseum]|uniref:Uncharacterized protein n=1 Tax=Trichothecium roseum TaxID=47278 RepID=A0ACC0VGT2_9HYPO|nr:hypothetical protein N3K66_001202 [Trichothecium roseum]
MASESASAWPPSASTIAATALALAATATVLVAAANRPARGGALRSPRKTVRAEDMEGLVYREGLFPGARDVETPYGTVRAYEFGPEDGQKVLFIHGISTPCVTLGPIAEGLAARGYRVLLYDLFGRGFSDGVVDLPHDARLYVSQALLVLASSPLSWTGAGASSPMHVVGYSLGGGIAVHLASSLPAAAISSLVLLAPAGLIRPERFGVASRVLFKSGLVPDAILAPLTRRRLQRPIASARKSAKNPEAEALAVAEAVDPAAAAVAANTLSRDVLSYVRWMVRNHAGFVPAFMSSIRHAPLTDQHDAWGKLAARPRGATVVVLAEDDEIIDVGDMEDDALPLVGGKDRVHWRVLPGGHDFVMTHADDILTELHGIWA